MKKKGMIFVVIGLIAVAAGAYFFLFQNKEPVMVESSYSPGDFFVTNIHESKAMVKTTLVLGLYIDEAELENAKAFLKENNHIIREVIVFTLRSKTEEQLRSLDVKDVLRDEIVKNVNAELGIEYISTIYFNDYVVN